MPNAGRTNKSISPSMKLLCAKSPPGIRIERIMKRFKTVVDAELMALEQSGCIQDAVDTGDVISAILENRLRNASKEKPVLPEPLSPPIH